MYKLDKRAYNKYFLHGLGNEQNSLEGIIYFTYYNDVRDKILAEKNTNKSGDKILNELVKRVEEIYIHYYRFITVNDGPNVKEWKSKEKDGKIEIKERVKAKIDELIRNGVLVIQDNNIFFSGNAHREYSHKPEGALKINDYRENELRYVPIRNFMWNDDIEDVLNEAEKNERAKDNVELMINGTKNNIDYRLIHWSEELYKVLVGLDDVCKNDKIRYTNLWYLTRLARIKNGTVPNSSFEEVEEIEEICKKFKKYRQMSLNKNIETAEIEL